MSKEKRKLFNIIHVNCGGKLCGSHLEARRVIPKGVLRCKDCGYKCDMFEWKVLGKVWAQGDMDAIRLWDNGWKALDKNTDTKYLVLDN